MVLPLHPAGPPRARGGFTLIEVMIALSVVTVILLATTAALQKEAQNVSDMQRLSYSERLVQDLFTKMEQRLDFSQGIQPVTTLTASLGAGASASMALGEEFGLPFNGVLVIEPGTSDEERVGYGTLDPATSSVAGLERGSRGTSNTNHPTGSVVLWDGCCFPVEDQVAPAAGTFDGRTDDLRGPVFFRGDGVGFSYRKPVDPAGTGTFIGPTGIRWGATVEGRDTEDGCAALVFRPVATITEADRNFDINQDGDLLDTFDLGRISDLSWNAIDPALGSSTIDLVAPIILQEQDAYGADLDGDGFDDPMFLWSPDSGRLRVRIFALLGDVRGREIVRRFETVIYLRNGSWQ